MSGLNRLSTLLYVRLFVRSFIRLGQVGQVGYEGKDGKVSYTHAQARFVVDLMFACLPRCLVEEDDGPLKVLIFPSRVLNSVKSRLRPPILTSLVTMSSTAQDR